MNFDGIDFANIGKLFAFVQSLLFLWSGTAFAVRSFLLRRNGVRSLAKITDSRVVLGSGKRYTTYYSIEFVDHNGQLRKNEVSGFRTLNDVITNSGPRVAGCEAKTGDIPMIFDRHDPTYVEIDAALKQAFAPSIMIVMAAATLLMLARDVRSNYF